MRNPNGYAVWSYDDGRIVERDTAVCKHCGKHFHIKPFMDPKDMGGGCSVCGGILCQKCVGKGCDELERKLERWEAADRLYRDMRD